MAVNLKVMKKSKADSVVDTESKPFGKIKRILVPRGQGVDVPILLITMILLVFGLVMLYSASYVRGLYQHGDSRHYIDSQLKYAFIGIFVMWFASKVDYHFYRNWGLPLLVLVYGLLVLALFMPEINGVHRWIVIKNVITFQPSEIAKFTVILIFANLIENRYDKMKTFEYGIKPFIFVLATIVALLYLEPHLSCIVIICAVSAIMMFTGGSDVKWFGAGIRLLLGAVMMAFFLFGDKIGAYVMPRIDSWFHPERDPQGVGYQSYNSLLAIGSGGLFGLGLGNSRQKHLHLPEPQNDFIFSVLCEELGFIGGMIVLILFIALFLRGVYIATHAKDKYGAMMVVGIVSQITLQALLNIAVATNTIPNTGISLPFFSEGGTALVMIMGEMGIVLSVSRFAHLYNGEKE